MLARLFSVAAFLGMTLTAQGAGIFVAPGGSDQAAGTLASPLRTMQRACDLVL